MFQELGRMRKRLSLYYTLVLVLFTSLFAGAALINFIFSNQIMTDRDLKATASQVSELNTIPVLNLMPLPNKDISRDEQYADSLYKFVLWDVNMNVTQSSVQHQALFQLSQDLARQSCSNQSESWDTIELQGTEYRIFSMPFHNNTENGIVQTYCNLTMMKEFLSKFVNILLVTTVAAIVLAALIGWWLAGRAMQPVKLAWQRQKDFIADVSHELRTPLTVIQSNLDVVLADQSDSIKQNMNWLCNAYSGTENMSKLISNLLFLARVDAREIKFDNHEFDLSTLLRNLASQFVSLFQGKNLQFSSDIESDVKMHGDELLIRQMVGIFLDNASKYTLEGGSIRLKMHKHKNTIEILVEDSGIGIDDSEKENIFLRFYQIDKGRARKQGGTGLGLAIAAWIASEHKGNIQVSSIPGKGSAFKVSFPKW